MDYGDSRICKILAGEFESHASHKCSVRLMVRTLGFQPKNTSSILVRNANGPIVYWIGHHPFKVKKTDRNRLGLQNLGSYTVGVAGQTVNLLPPGSGGSTPSLPTKFGPIV